MNGFRLAKLPIGWKLSPDASDPDKSLEGVPPSTLPGDDIPASEALEITLVCSHCISAVLPNNMEHNPIRDKVEKPSLSGARTTLHKFS